MCNKHSYVNCQSTTSTRVHKRSKNIAVIAKFCMQQVLYLVPINNRCNLTKFNFPCNLVQGIFAPQGHCKIYDCSFINIISWELYLTENTMPLF